MQSSDESTKKVPKSGIDTTVYAERMKAALEKLRNKDCTHSVAGELRLKALRVIEGLCFEDLSMTPQDRIDEIYKYAHIAIGRCENEHKEWWTDLDKAEASLVGCGIMSPMPIMEEGGPMKTFDEFREGCPWCHQYSISNPRQFCSATIDDCNEYADCDESYCAPYRAYRMAVEDRE